MSPEKEKWLIEAAQIYEAAVQKAAALREKRDKLRATEREVQKQLEVAAMAAEEAQRTMFDVVASDLPSLPSIHDAYMGKQLSGQSTIRVDDLGQKRPSSVGAVASPPNNGSLLRDVIRSGQGAMIPG